MFTLRGVGFCGVFFFHSPLLIIESRRGCPVPSGGRAEEGAAGSARPLGRQGALRGVMDSVRICRAPGPHSALPGCAPAQAVSQGEHNTSRLWPILSSSQLSELLAARRRPRRPLPAGAAVTVPPLTNTVPEPGRSPQPSPGWGLTCKV